MPRTRDLVALSAILIAPLAATLVLMRGAGEAPAPAQASTIVEPPAAAPVVVAQPAAVEPPTAVEIPPTVEPPPAVEPPTTPGVVVEAVAEPPAPAHDPAQIMLLKDKDLVLHTQPDPTWSTGRLSIIAKPGQLTVSRKADLKALPPSLRALADATVTVYDTDGSACVAAVGPLRAEQDESGDVYMDLAGDDDGNFDAFEPPADKAALRKHAEESFQDPGQLLLARQKNQKGKPCPGVWARRADLPAPAVYGRRELAEADAKALTATALAAVRAQPEFPTIEAAYAARVAEYGADAGLPPWDEFVTANFTATRWDEVGGPRKIVSIELEEKLDGCGDVFDGHIALLFEQQGDALVRLPQTSWLNLVALMDLDRDGVLEGVTNYDLTHTVVSTGPSASVYADAYSDNYVGCRC